MNNDIHDNINIIRYNNINDGINDSADTDYE